MVQVAFTYSFLAYSGLEFLGYWEGGGGATLTEPFNWAFLAAVGLSDSPTKWWTYSSSLGEKVRGERAGHLMEYLIQFMRIGSFSFPKTDV